MGFAIGIGNGLHLRGYPQKPNVFKDATTALSLENLGLGNITKLVNVRRSTDNTEQEFSYLEIKDGSLTSFCGAGDGFIVNWYDQSLTANHAFNTIASEQPQIVSAGALILENGKPIVDGSGGKKLMLSFSLTGSNKWFFEVGKSAYKAILLGETNNFSNYAYASESASTDSQINSNCVEIASYINGVFTTFANRGEVYLETSTYHLATHNLNLNSSFNLLGYEALAFSMRSSQAVVMYSNEPEAGREAVEATLKSIYNTP